jgi:Tol biopolymer transport system component
VYLRNGDGSVRLIIPAYPEVINAQVSPNGAMIAYTCGPEICLANADGSNRRLLLQNGLRKDHLAWSPDSGMLAFTQQVPGANQTSVHLVDLNGRERPLVDNGGWPYWSPDGTRIVFSSDMRGVANLYVYDLNSLTYRQLTFTRAADITSVWIR